MSSFYHLVGPTRWAEPPQRFSYTSFKGIERCPLRWQLEHSEFDTFGLCPRRPSEAAMVGTIVHEVLDLLFRSLARAGLPERGTSAFQAAIGPVQPMSLIQSRLKEATQKVDVHPRSHGIRIRQTAPDVYAKVALAFQRQYSEVTPNRRSALKQYTADEVRSHPSEHSAP